MYRCNKCRTHGIIENDRVMVPCIGCAAKTDWTWNGQTYYGSHDRHELDGGDYVWHMYNYFNHILGKDTILNVLPQELQSDYIVLAEFNNFRNRPESDYSSSSPP
jgi:hypothetical protein